MSSKPKCAADKKNRINIRFEIQQPILKRLKELHYAGGVMSLLSEGQIVDIADKVTGVVMMNENINIILRKGRHG